MSNKHKKADPPRVVHEGAPAVISADLDARHDFEAASSSPQWNNISRKWMREVNGEAVAMDPQPPAPRSAAGLSVPPAVKVMA